jgi:5'(3')-deoxyribonucleotidase
VSRRTHPDLDETTREQIIRRLGREARQVGLQHTPAHREAVEALLDATEFDLEAYPMDPTYRALCLQRLNRLRASYAADPNSITEEHTYAWQYLRAVAGNEVGREHRTDPLTVGVDVDGVLYDCHLMANTWMDARGIPRAHDHMDRYDLATFRGISQAELMAEFDAAVRAGAMFRYGDALPDGTAAVRRIYQAGHRVTIITARDLPGLEQESTIATLRWLHDKAIPFDTLQVTSAKQQVEFDVLIDDAPRNAEAMTAHGRRAVILDRPWNRTEGHGHERKKWLDVARELCRPAPDQVLFDLPVAYSDAAQPSTIPLGTAPSTPSGTPTVA